MRASPFWGAAVLLVSACATHSAPETWLPTASRAPSHPYGAWTSVTMLGDSTPVAGEFLAGTDDTVYVLTLGGEVRRLPIPSVVKARVAFYDAQGARYGAWTAVGAISTLSHGYYLLITAPLWVVTGTAATYGAYRGPVVDIHRPADWLVARKYARFPAGPPPGLPTRFPPWSPR